MSQALRTDDMDDLGIEVSHERILSDKERERQRKILETRIENDDLNITEYIAHLDSRGWLNSQIEAWRVLLEDEFDTSSYETPKGKYIRSPFKNEKTGSFHADSEKGTFRYYCFSTGLNGSSVLRFMYHLQNPNNENPSSQDLDEFVINHAIARNYPMRYSITGTKNEKYYKYEDRAKDVRETVINALIKEEILVKIDNEAINPTNQKSYYYQLNPNISTSNLGAVHDIINNIHISLDKEHGLKQDNFLASKIANINRCITTVKNDAKGMIQDLLKYPENRRNVLLIEDKLGRNTNLYNIETGVLEIAVTSNEVTNLPLIGIHLRDEKIKEKLYAKDENGNIKPCNIVITNNLRRAHQINQKENGVAITLPTAIKTLTKQENSRIVKQGSPYFHMINAISEVAGIASSHGLLIDDMVGDPINAFKGNNHKGASAETRALFLRNCILGASSNMKIGFYNHAADTRTSVMNYLTSNPHEAFDNLFIPKQNNYTLSQTFDYQKRQRQEFAQVSKEISDIKEKNRKITEANKKLGPNQTPQPRIKEPKLPRFDGGRERNEPYVQKLIQELTDSYKRSKSEQLPAIKDKFLNAENLTPEITYQVNLKNSGLKIPENSVPKSPNKTLLANVNEALNKQFELKRDNAYFKEFLSKRGLDTAMDSNGVLLYEKFGLGYSDGTELDALRQQGMQLPNNILSALGLYVAEYDSENKNEVKAHLMTEKRITFNIKDVHNNIISFAGRIIDNHTPAFNDEDISATKYKNGRSSLLFDKNATLYGINEAYQAVQEKSNIIITEGYMDCIACHAAGVENAVATLGTSYGYDKMQETLRYANTITMVLDGDTAGRNAAMKAAMKFISDCSTREEVLNEYGKPVYDADKKPVLKDVYKPSLFNGFRDFNVVFLPRLPQNGFNDGIKKGLDPDEFIQLFGKENFQKELEKRIPLDEVIVQSCFEDSFENNKLYANRYEALNDDFAFVNFKDRIQESLKGIQQRIQKAQSLLNENPQQPIIQEMIDNCSSFVKSVNDKAENIVSKAKWLRAISQKEGLTLLDTYYAYGNVNEHEVTSRLLFPEFMELRQAQHYQDMYQSYQNELATKTEQKMDVQQDVAQENVMHQEQNVQSQPKRIRQ